MVLVKEQNDILEAVLKAMQITEEMGGSQSSFLQILQYGKDLYYKNHIDNVNRQKKWPSTWQSAIKLLEEHGYKDPINLYICLADCHPTLYNVMDSTTKSCSLCNKLASNCIAYSYLPLKDKIQRWCGNAEFCRKITAHWENRDHWLRHTNNRKEEIWDGNRFSELAWFWNPLCEWTIPAKCPFCNHVVSACEIEDARVQFGYLSSQIELECSVCYNKFQHIIKRAKGDPRNIALIGHYDGWQPFSTSSKHSSGEVHAYTIMITF